MNKTATTLLILSKTFEILIIPTLFQSQVISLTFTCLVQLLPLTLAHQVQVRSKSTQTTASTNTSTLFLADIVLFCCCSNTRVASRVDLWPTPQRYCLEPGHFLRCR
ncbi:hypothetical protein BDP27DRAFT_297415 [Rhodocollybia butyracea]|uniref:Uncharacterized protein n=1 Tax=Rhodocollybia butyracea TaxID=206335 RepID=A0A9P5PBV4_9AGAR|nr:hypothetical protein BDP27DRAFT_297415 [Rhodocollybia butyracea]